MKEIQILTQSTVDQIIKRIAYQIIENNFGKTFVILGIETGGFYISKRLQKELEEISKTKPMVGRIFLDKASPLSNEVVIEGLEEKVEDKIIILCDDVFNTGKTLAYAIQKIISNPVQKIETVALILRRHGLFPIHVSYKGYELATSLSDTVVFKPSEGVFLQYKNEKP